MNVLTIACLLVIYSGMWSAEPGDATADEPMQGTERSMKGWDLYSWKDDHGACAFALLSGTNGVKDAKQVRDAACDLAHIKRSLAQLPRGEQVFWVTPEWTKQCNPAVDFLFLPSQETIADIAAICAVAKIELNVPRDPSAPARTGENPAESGATGP
jgi:hypothetical protein